MRRNNDNVGTRRFLRAAFIIIASASLANAAIGQDLEPSDIDVSTLGPQVGDIVPEFSLPDQSGKIWTRESIMGARGAMLVFIRSADW